MGRFCLLRLDAFQNLRGFLFYIKAFLTVWQNSQMACSIPVPGQSQSLIPGTTHFCQPLQRGSASPDTAKPWLGSYWNTAGSEWRFQSWELLCWVKVSGACCNDSPYFCLHVLGGQHKLLTHVPVPLPISARRQQHKSLSSCSAPGRPQRVKLKTLFKVSLFCFKCRT